MRVDVTNIGIIQEASIQIDGITIIAAPNDCGKTTLLRLIYTLHDASNSTPSLVIKEYFARYFFQHIARIDHRFRFFINLPHFESGLRSEVIDFLYSGSIDKDSIENFTSVLIKQIESSLERNDFLFDHVGEKLKARDVGPLRKHIFDFFYEAKDKPLLDVEQYTSMLLSKKFKETGVLVIKGTLEKDSTTARADPDAILRSVIPVSFLFLISFVISLFTIFNLFLTAFALFRVNHT